MVKIRRTWSGNHELEFQGDREMYLLSSNGYSVFLMRPIEIGYNPLPSRSNFSRACSACRDLL